MPPKPIRPRRSSTAWSKCARSGQPAMPWSPPPLSVRCCRWIPCLGEKHWHLVFNAGDENQTVVLPVDTKRGTAASLRVSNINRGQPAREFRTSFELAPGARGRAHRKPRSHRSPAGLGVLRSHAHMPSRFGREARVRPSAVRLLPIRGRLAFLALESPLERAQAAEPAGPGDTFDFCLLSRSKSWARRTRSRNRQAIGVEHRSAWNSLYSPRNETPQCSATAAASSSGSARAHSCGAGRV